MNKTKNISKLKSQLNEGRSPMRRSSRRMSEAETVNNILISPVSKDEFSMTVQGIAIGKATIEDLGEEISIVLDDVSIDFSGDLEFGENNPLVKAIFKDKKVVEKMQAIGGGDIDPNDVPVEFEAPELSVRLDGVEFKMSKS